MAQSLRAIVIGWIAAFIIPCLNVGLVFINKVALDQGVDYHVLAVYRNIIASLVLLVLAFSVERGSWHTITRATVLRVAALAVFEPLLNQNFAYAGLSAVSPAFSSAIGLVTPTATFLLTCFVRIERLVLPRKASVLKVSGASVAIIGVIIVAVAPSNIYVIHHATGHQSESTSDLARNDIDGVLFCIIAVLSAACYNTIMRVTIDSFHHPLTVAAGTCLLGAIFNVPAALLFGSQDKSQWMILMNMRLVSYLYSGLVVSAAGTYLMGIATVIVNPSVLSSVSLLSTVIVTFISVVFLHESLLLARLLGVVAIGVAVILLIVGKVKETPEEKPGEHDSCWLYRRLRQWLSQR